MNEDDVKQRAFAMPLTSPAFPPGPYRYYMGDITVKSAWEGPAALELFNHALAPVASLPVLEVLGGVRIMADLTLGLGTVIHDYSQEDVRGWPGNKGIRKAGQGEMAMAEARRGGHEAIRLGTAAR